MQTDYTGMEKNGTVPYSGAGFGGKTCTPTNQARQTKIPELSSVNSIHSTFHSFHGHKRLYLEQAHVQDSANSLGSCSREDQVNDLRTILVHKYSTLENDNNTFGVHKKSLS